jgi:hypothetical protein
VFLDVLIFLFPIVLLMLPLSEEPRSNLCIVLRALGPFLSFFAPLCFVYDYDTRHSSCLSFSYSSVVLLFTYGRTFSFLSIHVWINIGVVPEHFIPVTDLQILVATPSIFFLFEAMFCSIITHESSDDLGYFGQFHRGLWPILQGWFNDIILL